MTDMVNHPPHYTQFEYEVIELTRQLCFSAGNCVKYLVRCPFKDNSEEDLAKAIWYARDVLSNPEPMNSNDKRLMHLIHYFSKVVASYDIPNAKIYSLILRDVCYKSIRMECADIYLKEHLSLLEECDVIPHSESQPTLEHSDR